MKKLKMADVLTREGYEVLTAAERRLTLKIEQAKEYSGLRPYRTTCERTLDQLPGDIWDRYTDQQIGEIMQLVNNAYNAGKNAVDKRANP